MIMGSDILVVAAGGHGRVVLDALLISEARVRGLVDPQLKPGSEVMGAPVLGGDEVFEDPSYSGCHLANGIGANPSTQERTAIFLRLKALGYEFVKIIHPSATVSPLAKLDEGCQIMAKAVVQCGTHIGRNVVVNTAASIDHDSVIADNVFISPGAILCGNVELGNRVFVGAGAILLPGIEIGEDAIIAAGAIVRQDVPAGKHFYGESVHRFGKI